MKTKFGVQTRRPSDLPDILRRIAAKRGKDKPYYTVADLLRDCLIAYTNDHTAFQRTGVFRGNPQATVYVRGNRKEHKYFLEIADANSISLGRLLEAAIMYHCGIEIAEMRKGHK